MIFSPKELCKTEGRLILQGEVSAMAHPCLCGDVIREFWHNFSFLSSELHIVETEAYVFSIGEVEALPTNGYDYSINIEPRGVCVCANNEEDLIRGLMTLLDRFTAVECDGATAVALDCCQIRDRAMLGVRMVHFCILPETELWEVKRFVRLCGALRYTHIIFEFWGMLRYDCMTELAWSHAFSKDEIRPIIDEARALGLRIVPMFNHWGHASAGRVMHGKHVVLDQNPSLQTYFNDDGWCWAIEKPKVRALLARIREELIELCGEGEYFHIGCDEAYSFDLSERGSMDAICDFINETADELRAIGRRAIVWGDMFLYRHEHYNPKSKYTCNSPSLESAQYMIERLTRAAVIADWQYDATATPVETSLVFRDAGFDCLICPWDSGVSQMNACLTTARDERLYGLIHTTWHTLSSGMPYVVMAATCSFEGREAKNLRQFRTPTAALLRKVMPSGGDYERAGWSKKQVDFRW